MKLDPTTLASALILTLTASFASAAPPSKPDNPGVPGLLAEIEVLEEEVATLQQQIDADLTQITALETELGSALDTIVQLDAENGFLGGEVEALELAVTDLISDLEVLETLSLIPRTGQQTCRDMDGDDIPCAGTDQDGETRHGLAWPDPRLVDNGDGTVTDHLTGLVWLKDTRCIAALQWDTAVSIAPMLADAACGLTDGSESGDWRLPNVRELFSLVDFGQFHSALPDGHPFVGVDTVAYWTSTSVLFPHNAPEWMNGDVDEAWAISFTSGAPYGPPKETLLYVWPVRSP